MSYPRLVEKFGKRYSWKIMLNPCSNMNERLHPKVGDINSKARETYYRGWKRCLRHRVKPTRAFPMSRQMLTAEPGASMRDATTAGLTFPLRSSSIDPKLDSLSQKVASSLSKVRTPQLSELVAVGNIIGSGVEGVVRPGITKKCTEMGLCFEQLQAKIGDRLLAVKTVEKGGDGYAKAAECREVKVLEKIGGAKHPNVTPYVHTFESPVRFHIVTELNQGGDLFSYLQEHDFERQAEKDAARVLMQLFCGVKYVHESGFVHLDLKLENVMRKKKGPEIDSSGVCLIDFGHASPIPTNDSSAKLSRPVGSPSYAAPEIVLSKEFSSKSDSWSLGVIMYILLQGYLPFPHLQQKKWREFSVNDYGNFDKGIVDNDPFYYSGDWEDISVEAKELCMKLMRVNVADRIKIEEAIAHPWFEQMGVRMTRDETGLPVMESFQNQNSENSQTTEGGGIFSWL